MKSDALPHMQIFELRKSQIDIKKLEELDIPSTRKSTEKATRCGLLTVY
jgi:hypothetical protein